MFFAFFHKKQHCKLKTEKSLQKRNFLHTEDFLQRNLYSKELLHTNVLELLHTKIITQKNLYIASFNIQMWVCTRKLFHTEKSLHKRREVALSVEIEIAESGHLRPLAGSGHLRPLVGSGHLRPLAGSGHLRPLAATRWEGPLAATCGHSLGAAPCGHLRPLAGNCMGRLLAATRLERPLAATRLERPLAATCGHSSGCKWLRVAANGRVSILKKNSFAGKAFFSNLEVG